MSFLEAMRGAAEDEIVGYTDFMLTFSEGNLSLHCFYEGNDDEIYYSPIVRVLSGVNCESYTCRSKSGVLRVYNLVKTNYTQAKSGFFIDRDFDPPHGNDEIYETPFYSFENFYVQVESFQRVLIQQFHIPKKDNDFENATFLYKALQNKFHEMTTPLNAWLSCHADERNKGNLQRLNIDSKIKLAGLVILPDLSDIEANDLPQSFEDIELHFQAVGTITKENFEKKLTLFQGVHKSQVFRGKFEFRFLCNFLTQFKKAVENKKAPLLSTQYTSKLQFQCESLITQLSGYAHVPQCLREYIYKVAA